MNDWYTLTSNQLEEFPLRSGFLIYVHYIQDFYDRELILQIVPNRSCTHFDTLILDVNISDKTLSDAFPLLKETPFFEEVRRYKHHNEGYDIELKQKKLKNTCAIESSKWSKKLEDKRIKNDSVNHSVIVLK